MFLNILKQVSMWNTAVKKVYKSVNLPASVKWMPHMVVYLDGK